jgi:hypothetical protein
MFSKKSQDIIDYRQKKKHWPMEAVAKKCGVKRQWVYLLCKRAGVQSAAEPYVGMDVHLKGIPRDLVESVKSKSKEEGLPMKIATIELWENYTKGIDNNKT